jgi:hypothetical protein
MASKGRTSEGRKWRGSDSGYVGWYKEEEKRNRKKRKLVTKDELLFICSRKG